MSLEVAIANVVVFIYYVIVIYTNQFQSGVCTLLTYHKQDKTEFFLIDIAKASKPIPLGTRRRSST